MVDLANSPPSVYSAANCNSSVDRSSDLVREANEKIRFSIHFDARKNQQMQANKFFNVREDLYKVKQDIQGLKNDIKSAEQPLMVRIQFHNGLMAQWARLNSKRI